MELIANAVPCTCVCQDHISQSWYYLEFVAGESTHARRHAASKQLSDPAALSLFRHSRHRPVSPPMGCVGNVCEGVVIGPREIPRVGRALLITFPYL